MTMTVVLTGRSPEDTGKIDEQGKTEAEFE